MIAKRSTTPEDKSITFGGRNLGSRLRREAEKKLNAVEDLMKSYSDNMHELLEEKEELLGQAPSQERLHELYTRVKDEGEKVHRAKSIVQSAKNTGVNVPSQLERNVDRYFAFQDKVQFDTGHTYAETYLD